jgi:methylenetetrahydrofolate reductase (NADPH)
MFFYAEDYLRLRDRVGRHGCDVPIIPGIMPVTSLRVVERALELGGCKVPPDLLAPLRKADEKGDKAAIREIGVSYAAALAERLLAEDAPGLHFYTLNWSRATREIYQLLGLGERGQGWSGASSPGSLCGDQSGSRAPITA